ncbi:hypothetical protein SAMN02800692_1884 [Luteibacter sp. UNC138MFCol5.1]|uniref:hypothetical protein n=1 Tax=Luteibacter sp. UNC138MFCol5.1 TaxID=1502774 RepID=UPI0008C10760|nr:hypothetical protein [Luteibacter sp. UNC138MFCol5.1]SEO74748.1 hypothetical protein SAMN02800692_1884 [Luteibacter sp. UNC138MFCol5.1]
MNPNTPPPNDDDLPDERELAAMYARLPKAEPDAALDARVRHAATSYPAPRLRSRWPVALGSAAVLVLAAGVAWRLRDAHPPAASSAPTAVLREQVPIAVPEAASPANADASSVTPTSSPVARSKAADTMARRPMKHVPAPPMAAPMPAAPMAPPAPPVAPAPPAPPPPPAPPADIADEPPRLRVQAIRAPAPAAAQGFAANPALGPDDRVGEIRRLLGRGQRDEALRRLRELRERYPRYELPQDLRDLTP